MEVGASNESRGKAAFLLRSVADGKLSATAAMQDWPFDPDERWKPAAIALHALSHFEDDEDIRARDASYAERTQQELREMAERLATYGGGQ